MVPNETRRALVAREYRGIAIKNSPVRQAKVFEKVLDATLNKGFEH
jgi:hypothetical protein